jgi:phosphate transport system permease protein
MVSYDSSSVLWAATAHNLFNSGDTLKEQLQLENVGVRRHVFYFQSLGDPFFSAIIIGFALLILALLAAIAGELIIKAMPSIRHFGFGFFSSTDWDPSADLYGALPFMYGTAVSSALALLIAAPLNLGVALCLSEMTPQWLSHKLSFLIELLAAIPSVVYGLWAIFVLGPWLRDWIEPILIATSALRTFVCWTARVGRDADGRGRPRHYAAALYRRVCSDVFRVVPQSQREAALALGNTKWKMVRMAVLPYGTSGIVGAIMLVWGARFGETISTAMVIGNRPVISASLFAQSSTLASVIANEFVEAMTELNVAALIELGLVLLALGLILNMAARLLVLGATQRRFGQAA